MTIKKAMHLSEGRKRKRQENEEGRSKLKVNFTRVRCYDDEEDLEKEVQATDGQMSKMHIESDGDK